MTQSIVFHNAIIRERIHLDSQLFLKQHLPIIFREWVIFNLNPCPWCIIKNFGFYTLEALPNITSGYKWWVSVWSKRLDEIMCKSCWCFSLESFSIPTKSDFFRKVILKSIIARLRRFPEIDLVRFLGNRPKSKPLQGCPDLYLEVNRLSNPFFYYRGVPH